MNSAGNKKNKVFILTAAFIIIPLTPVFAQVDPFGGFIPTQTPGVPVADAPLQSKDVGISIMGVSVPGITWDGIFIRAFVKPLIEDIITETTNWAASGFQGNPAYATDPGKFFTDVADGIAGDFIKGTDLGFLCSPFQTKIRLALLQSYADRRQFQCTLTGVVGNIDAFYNNFAEGGWNGWFVMTQNNANNPYGVFLDAKLELDSRIARAVNLQDKHLAWDGGFLSWRDCYEYNPDTGECYWDMQSGVITPGSTIQSALETGLSSELRQLELADELDELLSAVISGLLRKTVNSAQGLFR